MKYKIPFYRRVTLEYYRDVLIRNYIVVVIITNNPIMSLRQSAEYWELVADHLLGHYYYLVHMPPSLYYLES